MYSTLLHMRVVLILRSFKIRSKELPSKFRLQNSGRLQDNFSENLIHKNILRSYQKLSVPPRNLSYQQQQLCLSSMKSRNLMQSSSNLCLMSIQTPQKFSLLKRVKWKRTQVELKSQYSRIFLNSSVFKLIEYTKMP